MRNPFRRIAAILVILILFMGLTTPPVHTAYDWMVEGNSYDSDFGFWTDGGGDVNGDGYDDIIVGSPGYTHDFVGEGGAFIYFGSASGLSAAPDWETFGEHDSSGYGRCVSIAGDVNGDGYDDVLVGSHQFHNTKMNEGKVYYFKGGPDGPETTPSWTMMSGRKGAKLGEAVTILGDINLDGYDDICVGAHGWDDDEELGPGIGNKAGKAWVFLGSPAGPGELNMTEVGEETDANIGVSMDKAGDINNDGFMDVAIGGYIFLIGDGMICVFNGSDEGVNEDMEFTETGGASDTSFYAINLSTAGDLNGDGYDDVVIGAPRFDANGIYQSGKLHVHFGSPDGLEHEVGWTASGTQYDERWAFNVNEAGDLNHDGYGDLLVGSKYFDNGPLYDAGKAELYLGGPNGPQRNPIWTFAGLDTTSVVGTNLCRAGDVNGDGYDDILVSGDEYSGDVFREGVVYAFYGQPQACDPPQHPTILQLTPNSVRVAWRWLYGAQKYKFYMKRVDAIGTQYFFATQDSTVLVGGLVPGAHYVCYAIAKCDAGWTSRSLYLEFTTPVPREGEVADMKIFPTIVHDEISVFTGSASGSMEINIIDAAGNMVLSRQLDISEQNAILSLTEVSSLPPGSYFISVQAGIAKKVTQFIKQ